MGQDVDDLLNCCRIHLESEPGFRDVVLHAVGHDGQRIRCVELLISADDALGLATYVLLLHRRAWADGARPLDARADENRPIWIGE